MSRSLRLLSLGSVLALLALLPAAAAAEPAGRSSSGLSEAARWLQGYLTIDTSNPPGGEHRAARYLADILHRERIPTRLYVSPAGRANLWARLPATVPEPDGGTLVLTHHMDVVPEGPGWRKPAFDGLVEEDRLWGRGAQDAKGLGIAQLAAFVELKRSDRPRRRDVVFLAVADEEKGGGEGMGWLVEAHPELFEDLWAVFNEGGAGRIVGERLLWWEVEVAQKRPLWLRISADGRGGHGSGYNPNSAAHRLISALDRILELPRPYRVSPAARAHAEALAPLHNPATAQLLRNLDEHLADGAASGLLPGMYKLFADTVQVTVLQAGDSINVIPEEVSAELDIRLLPDTDAERFLAAIEAQLSKGMELEVLVQAPPAAPSRTDHEAYRILASVLGESAPVVPALLAGFTDSRHFRERGIPAYGLSPFAIEAVDMLGIHGPDERIPLAAFDDGIERMVTLVERCVAP